MTQVREKPARRSGRLNTAPDSRRPFWRLMLEGTLALVGTILVLEMIFSIAGIGEQEFLKIDPVSGFSPMENKHITWRKEGFGRAWYNSHGFRGPEIPLQKPQGTYRIAVLGDSYVEALQVDRPDTFCYLLESKLNETYPGSRFEVLNFGVSSYNFSQTYLRLKEKVLAFDPDLVVLAARVDTSFHLAPKPDGGFLYARPSFFLGADKNLIEDRTVQELWSQTGEAKRMRATAWLRKHSHIWGVVSTGVETLLNFTNNLDKALAGWGNEVAPKPPGFQSGSQESKDEPRTDILPRQTTWVGSSEQEQAATRYLWPIANALIKETNNECEAAGCRFMIVRLAGTDGRINEVETSLLKKTAGQIGAPFLDVTAPFHKALLAGRDEIFYATHLTPAGHRIMASELFRFLQKNVIPVDSRKPDQ